MKKGKKWKKIEAFCILLIVTLLLIFVKILYRPGYGVRKGASCTPSAMDGISWKSAWETGFSTNIKITDLKKTGR